MEVILAWLIAVTFAVIVFVAAFVIKSFILMYAVNLILPVFGPFHFDFVQAGALNLILGLMTTNVSVEKNKFDSEFLKTFKSNK